MNTYARLINPNYRHTYALIVHTTGEVYTYACDKPQYPLRVLYKRLDSLRRQWDSSLQLRAELIHLNSGKVVIEIDE